MINIPEKVMSEIATCYGTEKDSLQYLGGGHQGSDGIVYQYPHEGKMKALKFMIFPDKDKKSLLKAVERLKFVNFLGENGVNIVYPQHSVNGQLLEQYKVEDKIYIAYTMDKVEGKSVDKMTPEEREVFICEWGRVVGQLHSCTKKYPLWQHSFDETTGETILGWHEEWTGFEKWCQEDEIRECWRGIKEELEKLPADRESFGFIHNDPHPVNLLFGNNKVTLLDFDVANYHWFMNDIAIAVYGALCGEAGGFERPQRDKDFPKRFIDRFMSGYEKENHLDSKWFEHMELFLSYRRILLFIVFYEGLLKDKENFEHWKKRIINRAPILTY